jgi:hypothetical protein
MKKESENKSKGYMDLKNKDDVVKFERYNFDKVVLYPTGNDFWNATFNSCLFMTHLIHERLELKNKIKSVVDYYIDSTRIYTAYNLAQINKIRAEVKKLGYNILRDDGEMLIFELSEPITTEQVHAWRNLEDTRREKIQGYFMPIGGNTPLYVAIRSLGSEVVKGMERIRGSQSIIGGKLVDYLMDFFDTYTLYNVGSRGKDDMLLIVGQIAHLVAIMHDESVIDDKRAARIGDCLHNIRKLLAVGDKKVENGKTGK